MVTASALSLSLTMNDQLNDSFGMTMMQNFDPSLMYGFLASLPQQSTTIVHPIKAESLQQSAVGEGLLINPILLKDSSNANN